MTKDLPYLISSTAIISTVISFAILFKALLSYTRTGPQIKEEILSHYKVYTIYAIIRLAFWSYLIIAFLVWSGIVFYSGLTNLFGFPYNHYVACTTGFSAFFLVSFLQFCKSLLFTPSAIAVSWQYRLNRLYPLWRLLSPGLIQFAEILLYTTFIVILLTDCAVHLQANEYLTSSLLLLTILAAFASRVPLFRSHSIKHPATAVNGSGAQPNIIMIGSDTLRTDRLGVLGYHRNLTPNIDRLSRNATLFSNCYVPIGRTAPSLVSLFTGTWPCHHGIRDNYIADTDTELQAKPLPKILSGYGYRSATVADWSGGDLGKLNFGFDVADVPRDQWNLKYYLRQGPMDLRLFLTLFTKNRFGKRFLPELYYLSGIPITSDVGYNTRRQITRLATRGKPFLVNTFMGTTHVPFGCEYPYYTLFTNDDYKGDSKFVMSKFADPMEIIEMQEADRSQFDVEQIVNLYDSCIRRFDDEVGLILGHIEDLGISDNTIVVIYSDHGIDFFENHTWGQGNTVRGTDPSARIPLLIVDPRNGNRKIVSKITRSIDLAPTLLELLNIPLPQPCDGVSLKPYMQADDIDLRLPAFQETGIWLGNVPGQEADHIRYPCLLDLLETRDKRTGTLSIKREFEKITVEAKDRMIRDTNWKLTCIPLISGPEYRLYDTRRDPGCKRDLSAEYPQIFQQLKNRLDEWIYQCH